MENNNNEERHNMNTNIEGLDIELGGVAGESNTIDERSKKQ